MRAFTKTTYHFQQNGAGNAPDEGGARRVIVEIGSLLSLGVGEDSTGLSGAERRAINAMTQGFTAEQFKLFREVVAREIAARRTRHADAAVNSPFSRMILRETDGIEAMAKRTFDEIEALMAAAERVIVTGLEPNSIERLVEARGINA